MKKETVVSENETILYCDVRHLPNIKQYCAEGKTIYYLHETSVNQGHTKQMVWQDQIARPVKYVLERTFKRTQESIRERKGTIIMYISSG
jgi:hypothetical protein